MKDQTLGKFIFNKVFKRSGGTRADHFSADCSMNLSQRVCKDDDTERWGRANYST